MGSRILTSGFRGHAQPEKQHFLGRTQAAAAASPGIAGVRRWRRGHRDGVPPALSSPPQALPSPQAGRDARSRALGGGPVAPRIGASPGGNTGVSLPGGRGGAARPREGP